MDEDIFDICQTLRNIVRNIDKGKWGASKRTGMDFGIHGWVRRVLDDPSIPAAQEFHTIRSYLETDPARYWKEYHKDCLRLLREITNVIYNNADIILCTPVVAKTLSKSKAFQFKPTIVWVDEAYRVTEPSTMAAFVSFPEAAFRVMSGDS